MGTRVANNVNIYIYIYIYFGESTVLKCIYIIIYIILECMVTIILFGLIYRMGQKNFLLSSQASAPWTKSQKISH